MTPAITADDSRLIVYPCYKSFDEYIDLDRLKSLDGYLTKKIQAHIARGSEDLFLNEHRLDPSAPHQPGAKEVWLTRTKAGTPYNYLDLDIPDLWEATESASEFSLLMDFIETLPFERIGRALIIYDDKGSEVPAHRDHLETTTCHNFIWFRTNLRKPFYMYDQRKHKKLYVTSYTAWFDTVNQFHGSDPSDGLAFSIRVDGIFTKTFRDLIPTNEPYLASTPALWANADSRSEVCVQIRGAAYDSEQSTID